MADTGWVTAGTGANNAAAGNTAWGNTGNITTATDAAYSEASSVAKSGSTQYLHAANFDFSSIPSGSTIDGIEALVRRQQTGTGGSSDNTIQLILGGSRTGSNLASSEDWSSSIQSKQYGGASNLWGLTPDRSDVISASFGLAIRGNNLSGITQINLRVYYVQIKVHYTEPEPAGNTGAMFMLWRMKDRIREILKPKKQFWLPEPAFARAA